MTDADAVSSGAETFGIHTKEEVLLEHYRRSALVALAITSSLGCSGRGVAGALLGGAVAGTATATAGVKSPSGGAPENNAPPVRTTEVSACARGDVQANLAIAQAFEDSMHELVVCGGMAQRFSMSFFNVLINLAAKADTAPKQFKYMGDGRYRVGDVMTITMALPFATSFGQTGDPIPFDIFDPKNYFTNFEVRAVASADLLGGSAGAGARLAVRYEEPKPGLELLGNLVTGNDVTLEFSAVVDVLSQVGLTQDINVDDQRGDAHVVYHAVSAPVPMRNLVFAAGSAPMSIRSATVQNTRGQVLTVTDWGMEFSGGAAGTMDGYVNFEVRGGDFDWAGRLVYPHRKTPDTSFNCL